MKWQKISEMFPPINSEILYFNGNAIYLFFVTEDKEITSLDYQCNRKECTYIRDECGCNWEIDKDDYWIPLPDQPERSKREDSQECEMRCSEHCGNTVRDK